MEDEQIVQLYWDRDEAAIEECERKYGSYCFTVANNILSSFEDSRECVNDTWLRCWNSIPPHRPAVLKLFLAKITRNLAFDRCRSASAGKRGGGQAALALEELEGCVAAPNDVQKEFDRSELEHAINRFIHSLRTRDGDVFLRRYFFTEEVSEIAQRYGLTEANVLMILSRTRKKLKAYLEKEGFTV